MDLLQLILSEVPFDKKELRALITTAPRRYKTYAILKRDGKSTRTIAQPAPEVKLLQHLLLKKVICGWPIHESATAYRPGMSIAEHVQRHVHSKYLLKLDFANFFPSITSADIKKHAQRHSNLTNSDLNILVNILSWRNKISGQFCLSIGAPSSPNISNSMMFEFDTQISEFCKARRVTYSRYADDLAFSTNEKNVLATIQEEVRVQLLALDYPKLAINEKKTINVSKKYSRTLVGLKITPDEKVSLGRERKRHIRAQLYRFENGFLSIDEVLNLKGLLAFAWSVEPSYVVSLATSRGNEVFEKLQLPFRAGVQHKGSSD